MSPNIHTDFVNRYAIANDNIAFQTLGLTLFLHVISYSTASFCLLNGLYATMSWIIFRSLVLMRTFIVFHDCGHNAFFRKSSWNTILGNVLGIEIATPFVTWRKGHNFHHQTSGDMKVLNVEMMGKSGDTIFLTKKEWRSLPKHQRILVRIVRDPFVFFTLIPTFAFYVANRFTRHGRFVNAALIFKLAAVYFFDVNLNFVCMELCSGFLSASLGFILFHVQHGANRGYRALSEKYNEVDAALKGATFLNVPWFLKWATLGIEYHHIHHLNSRVPCYALQRCHEEADQSLWKDVNHLSLKDAFIALSNTLWDDELKEYVPFDKSILATILE